jgi:hypothetical protein
MKLKTCLAVLALSSGLMMVFAANVDKCTEKFDSCKESCGNLQAQCKARGSGAETCENRFKECLKDCDKVLKDCKAKK